MQAQWFRLYGQEYLNDLKIKELSASERSCWLSLLCYASVSNIPGEITHVSEKQLMLDAGVDPMSESWENTAGVLKRFEQMEMLQIAENGILRVVNWNKRQFVKLSGYDRIKRHRERKKITEQDAKNLHDSFEIFWTYYPRKVSKQKALESWIRVSPSDELCQKIMKSLEDATKTPQWKKDDGQFIPYPATWLNQDRWNDEMSIMKPKVGGGKFESVKSTKV
mgnify:CR=1 FL=1